MRSRVLLILLAVAGLAVTGAWVFHQAVLAQEEEDKEEARAELGVFALDVTKNTAERLDLPATEGAYIAGVSGRSAAYDAGIRNGDVIVEIDGKAVKSTDELAEIIKSHKPDDKIAVTFYRNGERQTLTVTLKKKKTYLKYSAFLKARPHVDQRVIVRPQIAALLKRPWIGINYQDLNKQLGEYFGVESGKGVLITEVFEDSGAEKAGLMAGDVIVSIDGRSIDNGSDLREAIWKFKGEEGETIAVEVVRKSQRMTFNVAPQKKDSGSWDVVVPRIHERLAPALEGLDMRMDALSMKLERLEDIDINIHDFDYHIDFDIPDFDILIPEHPVPPFMIDIDPLGETFRFHLRIDPDGKVIFNDKEFDSVEEFETYIDSDEYEAYQKEQREKLKSKIEEKLEKVKKLKSDRVRVVI